jgi:hypothetical protein
MYATKEAMLAKQRLGDNVECTVFIMDERAFNKEYSTYFAKAREQYHIRYIHCRVSAIREDPATHDLILHYANADGTLYEERFETVVLATGLQPPASARRLAELLDIELTETAMMADLAHAMDIFERLAAMGVRLSIDDFGTGMSSLSYLKRLPVNELKIDQSFVVDMAEDENNAVLVRSIIDLAHNIGREVVAEGVQDRDALQLLEMLGCDTAQGYFISRPRKAAELEEWLQSSEWGLRRPIRPEIVTTSKPV